MCGLLRTEYELCYQYQTYRPDDSGKLHQWNLVPVLLQRSAASPLRCQYAADPLCAHAAAPSATRTLRAAAAAAKGGSCCCSMTAPRRCSSCGSSTGACCAARSDQHAAVRAASRWGAALRLDIPACATTVLRSLAVAVACFPVAVLSAAACML